MKTKSHYIEELIEQGENQCLDFKFAVNDSKKIARTLVAFSNTKGGRLLIGVKDNGAIAGVRTDEEYHMIEGAAEIYCKPKISFETKDWTINGKKVLEIIIPESQEKPNMALVDNNKWMAFVRVADENILADAVLLKVWQNHKKGNGIKIYNTEPGNKLLMYINDNKEITLQGFLKLAKISYHKGIQILSDLITIGLIEIDYANNHFVYMAKKNAKE